MKQFNYIAQIPNVDGQARAANFIVGAVLIASVFIAGSGNLGWLTLLPIIAVYPMFVAITGYSLHRALVNRVTRYIAKSSADEHYRLVLH